MKNNFELRRSERWCTKPHKTIALTTTEPKFICMIAAIHEAICLTNLEKEISPNP